MFKAVWIWITMRACVRVCVSPPLFFFLESLASSHLDQRQNPAEPRRFTLSLFPPSLGVAVTRLMGPVNFFSTSRPRERSLLQRVPPGLLGANLSLTNTAAPLSPDSPSTPHPLHSTPLPSPPLRPPLPLFKKTMRKSIRSPGEAGEALKAFLICYHFHRYIFLSAWRCNFAAS